MPNAKHTYAIRLTVDGGGKVKAELMNVGRTGDKALKGIEAAGDRASLGLSRLTDRARSLGQRMKLLYGVIVAGGAVRGLREIVRLYADFEAGLIGVGKTADLSGSELESLGKDIDALSKRIPVATDELLAIAQSAGQLGVKGAGNILKFTETVAKLGTATDLGGNEAAIALARILNVTGEAMGKVDVLGSVIVALGNNFAATESQIAEMATENRTQHRPFTNLVGHRLHALKIDRHLGPRFDWEALDGLEQALHDCLLVGCPVDRVGEIQIPGIAVGFEGTGRRMPQELTRRKCHFFQYSRRRARARRAA